MGDPFKDFVDNWDIKPKSERGKKAVEEFKQRLHKIRDDYVAKTQGAQKPPEVPKPPSSPTPGPSFQDRVRATVENAKNVVADEHAARVRGRLIKGGLIGAAALGTAGYVGYRLHKKKVEKRKAQGMVPKTASERSHGAYIASGALLGGLTAGLGAHLNRKHWSKSQHEEDRKAAKKVNIPLAASIGALSGGFLGHRVHGFRDIGRIGDSAEIGDAIKGFHGKPHSVLPYQLGGAAAGGLYGAAKGYSDAKRDNRRKTTKKERKDALYSPPESPGGGAVTGALTGTAGGYIAGTVVGTARHLGKYLKALKGKGRGLVRSTESIPDWAKGADSQARMKEKFRDIAKKLHPDTATDETTKAHLTEKFKSLQKEWEGVQKSKHFKDLPSDIKGGPLSTWHNPGREQYLKDKAKFKSPFWKHLRGRKLKSFIYRHPEAVGAISGGVGGGAFGALGGALKEPEKEEGETRKKNALKGAVSLGAKGALGGAAVGHLYKNIRDVTRYGGSANARHVAKMTRLEKENYEKAVKDWEARGGYSARDNPSRPFIGDYKYVRIGDRVNAQMHNEDAKKGLKKFFKSKHKRAQVEGFCNELDKISVDMSEAASVVPGLVGGYYTGRAAAGHAAASTAPHGYKTRSEDIARRTAMATGPLGAVGGLALARKHDLAGKAGDFINSKFPKGLIADPAIERAIIQGAVPMAAGIGGGALGGYVTGKAIGYGAKLKKNRNEEE
jgi:hypothetical protein